MIPPRLRNRLQIELTCRSNGIILLKNAQEKNTLKKPTQTKTEQSGAKTHLVMGGRGISKILSPETGLEFVLQLPECLPPEPFPKNSHPAGHSTAFNRYIQQMLFRCWETSELHHNRSEQLCPLLAIGRHRCTKRQAQRGNARVGDGLANLNPKPDHNRHGKNITCSLISLCSVFLHISIQSRSCPSHG